MNEAIFEVGFIDDRHRETYEQYYSTLESYDDRLGGRGDRERLFYVLAGYSGLRGIIDEIYDFETHELIIDKDKLEQNPWGGADNRLLHLAVEMYNPSMNDWTITDILTCLDDRNTELVFNALRIYEKSTY